MIEGTTTEPSVKEGTISIRVKNTTHSELKRLHDILTGLFNQGVMNTRSGSASIHFGSDGTLHMVKLEVIKWSDQRPVATRVAMYEEVIVEKPKI